MDTRKKAVEDLFAGFSDGDEEENRKKIAEMLQKHQISQEEVEYTYTEYEGGSSYSGYGGIPSDAEAVERTGTRMETVTMFDYPLSQYGERLLLAAIERRWSHVVQDLLEAKQQNESIALTPDLIGKVMTIITTSAGNVNKANSMPGYLRDPLAIVAQQEFSKNDDILKMIFIDYISNRLFQSSQDHKKEIEKVVSLLQRFPKTSDSARQVYQEVINALVGRCLQTLNNPSYSSLLASVLNNIPESRQIFKEQSQVHLKDMPHTLQAQWQIINDPGKLLVGPDVTHLNNVLREQSGKIVEGIDQLFVKMQEENKGKFFAPHGRDRMKTVADCLRKLQNINGSENLANSVDKFIALLNTLIETRNEIASSTAKKKSAIKSTTQQAIDNLLTQVVNNTKRDPLLKQLNLRIDTTQTKMQLSGNSTYMKIYILSINRHDAEKNLQGSPAPTRKS